MLVTCPRYSSYTNLKTELRARVKEFMTATISKYCLGTKPMIFVEDELAVRLFGNHCDIATISREVDKGFIKLSNYYDLYTDEFLSRYDSLPHVVPFNKTFVPLLPRNFKDSDAYLAARRKQYRDGLHETLRDDTKRKHVLLQFVTDNNINSWVSPIEHELGDGLAIITANISDLTVKCYYGGIYLPEEEMKLILSEII